MIGVIADDLTGASELGGIGVRHGLRAEVILHGECIGNADLLCIDTDSRACPANEAARRAAAAARKLRKAGACWVYKKVDSVLRGNVLPEIDAIQKALGLSSALLVPANPCFGRVIRKGRYFVNGKPIHQTGFARDPEYPRKSSNVLDMLKGSKAHRVVVSHLAEWPLDRGIVLGEVSSSSDVQEWVSRRNANTLLAGGAEFFGAALNEMGFSRIKYAPKLLTKGRMARELFVCGSTSDFTDRFVREAEKNGTPVFGIGHHGRKHIFFSSSTLELMAREAIVAFGSHSRLVLTIGRPLIENRAVARRLARYLAEIAGLVIAHAKPDHVYAEGGATAAELVRQLGWSRLQVRTELAPGVTTLSLPQRDRPLLTIKPGSYPGWPT
jgi:uncharacterized protein YgbK (DUF1537 family)